jgi:hypothetical protein
MRSEEDVPEYLSLICRCCGRCLSGDGECAYCGLTLEWNEEYGGIEVAELIEEEDACSTCGNRLTLCYCRKDAAKIRELTKARQKIQNSIDDMQAILKKPYHQSGWEARAYKRKINELKAIMEKLAV